MAMRIDETISGVKADLAIKVFGDDFRTLDTLGQQVLREVSTVRGAADPQMEITSGVAELSIRVDRAALARYGLNVTDVEEAVSSGGSGDVISQMIDGQKRYTVALRLPERYRTDPDAMRRILLRAPGGEQVTLAQVAHVEVTRGAGNDQSGRRPAAHRGDVQRARPRPGQLRRRSAVEDRSATSRFRPDISIEYGGQFENQDRATRRLMLIVPMVIALIFILLYFTFSSARLRCWWWAMFRSRWSAALRRCGCEG